MTFLPRGTPSRTRSADTERDRPPAAGIGGLLLLQPCSRPNAQVLSAPVQAIHFANEGVIDAGLSLGVADRDDQDDFLVFLGQELGSIQDVEGEPPLLVRGPSLETAVIEFERCPLETVLDQLLLVPLAQVLGIWRYFSVVALLAGILDR